MASKYVANYFFSFWKWQNLLWAGTLDLSPSNPLPLSFSFWPAAPTVSVSVSVSFGSSNGVQDGEWQLRDGVTVGERGRLVFDSKGFRWLGVWNGWLVFDFEGFRFYVSIIHTKVCYTRTTCEPSARLAAAGGGAAAIPAISRSSSGGSHTWVDMAWLRLGGTSESTPVAGTSRGKRSGRAGR